MHVPACTIHMVHMLSKPHIIIHTLKDKETRSIFMDTPTSLQNKVELLNTLRLNTLRLELLKQNGQIEIMSQIIWARVKYLLPEMST